MFSDLSQEHSSNCIYTATPPVKGNTKKRGKEKKEQKAKAREERRSRKSLRRAFRWMENTEDGEDRPNQGQEPGHTARTSAATELCGAYQHGCA
eukprot:3565426-Pleurochrysis_carterae.AAC.1